MITKWTAGSNVKRACKIFSIENNQFLYISKSVAIMVKFPADLVTFTGEILNGKLHFLCSDKYATRIMYIWISQVIYHEFRFHFVCHFVKRVRIWSHSGPQFLHIFPHSNWIRRDAPYLSVFSPNAGKYGSEKTPYVDTFHAVSLNHTEEHKLIWLKQENCKNWGEL